MKLLVFNLLNTRNSGIPLLLRIVLGGVMLPHGLQKTLGLFGGHGFQGTMSFFTNQMEIPAVFAFLAIAAESLGALGLIIGLFTRVSAFGVGVTMAVAAFIHSSNGFFMNWAGKQAGEGFEYHILAIGVALALTITGGGKASMDAAVAKNIAIDPV